MNLDTAELASTHRLAADAAVRNNADLKELVGMMPLNDSAKDAIWNVLIVAYALGMIAGIDAANKIGKP